MDINKLLWFSNQNEILQNWAVDHPLYPLKHNQSTQTMANFKTQLLILILVLVPIVALSEPEAVEALLRRLDSKRLSASVQEAAAKAVLKRLLPTHVDSFDFKIVSKVPSFFSFIYLFFNRLTLDSGFDFLFCFITASFQLGISIIYIISFIFKIVTKVSHIFCVLIFDQIWSVLHFLLNYCFFPTGFSSIMTFCLYFLFAYPVSFQIF